MKKIFVLTALFLFLSCFRAGAAQTGPVFFAIEPRFQIAKDFHEGLAAVKSEDRWGYVDYLGRIAIPFIYRVPEAGDFSLYEIERITCRILCVRISA